MFELALVSALHFLSLQVRETSEAMGTQFLSMQRQEHCRKAHLSDIFCETSSKLFKHFVKGRRGALYSPQILACACMTVDPLQVNYLQQVPNQMSSRGT